MINDELNRRLAEASEQVARLAKLRGRAADFESRHRAAVVAADHYQERLAKEERDVRRLEGTSIAGLLASLAGPKTKSCARSGRRRSPPASGTMMPAGAGRTRRRS